MRWRFVIRSVGVLTLLLGLTMLLPVLTGLYYRDASLSAGLLAAGITMVVGALMFLGCQARPPITSASARPWP